MKFSRTVPAAAFLLPLFFAAPSAGNEMSLENGKVTLTARDGGWVDAIDRETGITWTFRLGQARIRSADGRTLDIEQTRFIAGEESNRLSLTAPAGENAGLEIALSPAANSIEVSVKPLAGARSERIELMRDSLAVTAEDNGFVLVPAREGLLIPADGGREFSRRFGTYEYEGCHLAMLGLVKSGSALLVSWDDPYVVPVLNSKGGRIALDIALEGNASKVTLSLLGRSGMAGIARAYREIAKERGLVVTLNDKIRRERKVGRLIGASNIKLWSTFIRTIDLEGKETGKRLSWTFTESAAIAEHLKRDLGIDRALFMIGGWINRGYDNQHPDILPANPESGGNRRLAELSKRVRKLGYLFCLHDNYQDMYRDSPSWDESYLMRNRDGSLSKGGIWAGGQAWLTCSQKALELARRPQNLPAVRRLFRPDSYFIDTTYASGLMECFSPQHPLTRLDDMRYKQELSDYARGLFGIFGSECGREWAVPHADFFEGLTGVSGRGYHDAGLVESLGAFDVPLFEMVFRDCIAAWGKYGYDMTLAAPYVLRHILIGRPLNYHSLGSHLYWKDEGRVKASPSIASFRPAGMRSFDISYGWTVTGDVKRDWKIFVHFAGPERQTDREMISFQNDHEPPRPTGEWRKGNYVRTEPMRVRIPAGAGDEFDVLIGMWDPETGERALLEGNAAGNRRYLIGRIRAGEDTVRLLSPEARPEPDAGCFSRAAGGWAEGMCATDVFIKNTHEILSPLHETTARTLVTDFVFLTPDRAVRRTSFGDGTRAIVNYGTSEYRDPETGTLLPRFGFLIRGPEFTAFHAVEFSGLRYGAPALFSMRSLDGRPLAASRRIRVFHGFGDSSVSINGVTHKVVREAVLKLRH